MKTVTILTLLAAGIFSPLLIQYYWMGAVAILGIMMILWATDKKPHPDAY